MRYLIFVVLLTAGFASMGCTEAQLKADVQKGESVVNKVVTQGVNAIAAVRSIATPENIAKARAAIASVVSTTGPLHQAAVNAQKVLDDYQNGQATIDDVDNALAKAQSFTAGSTAGN